MANERTLSTTLAQFVTGLSYDKLPMEVTEKAKDCILDNIGVAIAGSTTSTGNMVAGLMRSLGGRKQSTIICGPLVPAPNAAFANGTLSHIHDMDDGNRFALGHPGSSSIPAALSLCEKIGANGKNLITAIVAGYEVFCRLGIAVNPSHHKRGFHTSATCGAFGASAAASKILNLDEESTANAIGIAGTQASGLREVTTGESRLKPIQPGHAAQSGVFAALLAKKGLTAPRTILEGKHGFLRAYADSYDSKKIADGLADSFHIMNTYFKFYAACRHSHSALDALFQLLDEHSVRPEEVKRIKVDTYSTAVDTMGSEYEPKTESTAKFSLPYCIATALCRRKLGPEEFSLEKIRDPTILQTARKVEVQSLPELDKLLPERRVAIVEITTNAGSTTRCRVDNAKGEPETRVTREDLVTKFMMLTEGIMSRTEQEKTLKYVYALDELKDIGKLTRLLARP